MTDTIKSAEEQLHEIIISALSRMTADELIPQTPIPSFKIEIPANKKNGDFAANVAMVSARAFHKAPKQIAEMILQNIDLDGSYFEKAEIAGPGFLNFFLSNAWFSESVKAPLQEKENYGKSNIGNGKRVIVEYVSANPTGPMHIGNARGGALGDGIASVLDYAGYDVTREFYINDAGNQIKKFGISLEARYLQHFDPSVEIPEDAYLGADITEHAENFIKIYGDKYLNSGSEERRKALVDYALPLNEQGLERDLKKYRIVYDNWFKESTLHADGSVKKVIDTLKEKGATYEKDGAVWFKATDYGADQDFVIVRANGIPTYVVPDIAYHYNKLVTRKFDRAIDIFGADHHGYVPRLKAALKALGVDASKLDVILMQMVRLVRDGETVKLSKRSGKAITLVTLLDEVPIDAARFFFNLRQADSHFEFDLDLAVKNTSENPVYYTQYAHARICSLVRQLEEIGVKPDFDDIKSLELLTSPSEKELARTIAEFPSVIEKAAKKYDPSELTKYAIDIASKFHKFYDTSSVKNAGDDRLRNARLLLSMSAGQTIANVLGILKISAPEKM